MDVLIEALTGEINAGLQQLGLARADHSLSRIAANEHQVLGLKLALGHALAVAATGAKAENPGEAMQRANTHLHAQAGER